MLRKFRIIVGLVVITGLSASGSAWGYAPRDPGMGRGASHMPEGSRASAPIGLQIFCIQHAEYCRGGGRSQVAFGDELMKMLNSVNRTINRQIRPRNDRGDVWSINVRVGDCEDYALTKRQRLIELGLPAGSLRIATALTRSGEGHAVLVVRTSQGDLVLDNRSGRIKPWNETGLEWIAISGANLRNWRTI